MSQREQVIQMQFEEAEQQEQAVTLGMWTFLASEVLFFGGIFLGYAVLRTTHAAAFEHASGHLNLPLGTLNTALLLLSSLFMAIADIAVKSWSRRSVAWLLGAVVTIGAIFLSIKFYEYHEEWSKGLVPVLHWTYDGPHESGVKLFSFLYFAMTGMHALHMIVGIGVIFGVALMAEKGSVGAHRPLPVEMSALYWHFVDLVWIFLYPMLYLIGAGGK